MKAFGGGLAQPAGSQALADVIAAADTSSKHVAVLNADDCGDLAP